MDFGFYHRVYHVVTRILLLWMTGGVVFLTLPFLLSEGTASSSVSTNNESSCLSFSVPTDFVLGVGFALTISSFFTLLIIRTILPMAQREQSAIQMSVSAPPYEEDSPKETLL